MRRGEIDGVVVGADRIAANGDTANKIGTYSVSVLAKEHGVPFYVAAPLSTVDLTIADGDAHPHRGARPGRGHLASAGSRSRPRAPRARHPAFDVTPAANIAAIITEAGVLRAPYAEALAAACAAGSVPRRDAVACGSQTGACAQGHDHGRRPGHTPVPAHRPHGQAHGAHPQPAR